MAEQQADVYSGEVALRFGQRDVTLRLRYREVARLKSEFGKQWSDRYRDAIDGDAEAMAKVLSITSGMSEDEVLDLPPAGHLRIGSALLDLFFIHQHGPDWEAERDKARAANEAAEVEAAAQAGPLLRLLTQLLKLLQRRQQSESRPATSGV